MQELDQRLSKIVEAARKKPVSVYRYGAPWVWIVSQDDWQGALKEVSSFIPAGHSLVLLRPQIDEVLDSHRDWLQPEPGMLIANGFQFMLGDEYWISVFPGLALLLTIVAINLVGDRLRDVLNPRLQR